MCFQGFKPPNITTIVLSLVQLDDKTAGWNFTLLPITAQNFEFTQINLIHTRLTNQFCK
jgi:hypothetical protein